MPGTPGHVCLIEVIGDVVEDRHVFWLKRVDPSQPAPDDNEEPDQEQAPSPVPPEAESAR
jgi:hypothetical protein